MIFLFCHLSCKENSALWVVYMFYVLNSVVLLDASAQ